MLGTLDQVGQKITCPDCHTLTIVPPPAQRPKPPPAVEIDRHDEYGVAAGLDQPAAGATYVKVQCPHCQTRLPATADMAGQQIVCPDCGTTTRVPEPTEAPSRGPPRRVVAEEYGVGEAIVTPEFHHVEDYRRPEPKPQAPALEAAVEPPEPPPARRLSPRWAFVSGVLNFPVYDGVWQRWVALSTAAVPVLMVLAAGISLALKPVGSGGDAPQVFAAMALIACSGVATLVWIAPAAAICLAVVQETAEGNDTIEHWPEAVYLDWMLSVLFIFNSLGAATFGGVGVRRLLIALDWPSWPAVPATVILTFPILLLSMLETGSALNPASTPIWRSLLGARWAWGLFYLETTLLVAAGVALTASAFVWAGLWGVALAAPVLMAGVLVYARLLGQLAWLCAFTAAEEEEEQEEEEEEPSADRADDLR